ncbi:hypothetical protein BCR42DRAFT_440621 [Absidia repens]|uniref:Uncharacterized protein n=1 Tax=Absidia repens TaxID=90262 RepID=A0A1X2I8I9_9FUNG|nr:hypothetical protein BCR42DRAFT_440621 [Absidia repens]
MVQASSFLVLLAFSAVMIQGAPLAARSKEHHPKDDTTDVQSKLQADDEVAALYRRVPVESSPGPPSVNTATYRPSTGQTSNCMTPSDTQPQQGPLPQQDTETKWPKGNNLVGDRGILK